MFALVLNQQLNEWKVRETAVSEDLFPLPDPPRFVINGADLLNEPMERWARQLNEYVQAVSVALEG